MAACFPVWPSGQVALGARCPQPSGACFAFYLWCVSPSLQPPPPSGAETRRVPGRWSWPAWRPWPSGSFPGRAEAERCLRVQESPGHLLGPVVGQAREAGAEAGPSCPHALAVASLRDRGGSPTLRYWTGTWEFDSLPAASRACEDSPQLPVRLHLLSARSWRGRRRVGSGLCWAADGLPRGQREQTLRRALGLRLVTCRCSSWKLLRVLYLFRVFSSGEASASLLGL